MRFLAAILAPLIAPALLAYEARDLRIPTVAAGATSNDIAAIIPVTRQSQVAISWQTTSTNLTARLSASVDGTTWRTNWFVFTFTTGLLVTNLNVGGLGYLRVDSVQNTGTLPATNTVRFGLKPGL